MKLKDFKRPVSDCRLLVFLMVLTIKLQLSFKEVRLAGYSPEYPSQKSKL